MRELFFFAIGVSLAFTVLVVSIVELIFTVKRRKAAHEVEQKIKQMKADYNASINALVLEDEKKLEEAEEKGESVETQAKQQEEELKAEFETKLDAITKDSTKALDTAKARAKKLEAEARQKADEYMKNRQQEVEEELMNLVLSVTKKVLPAGISYENHKELVMQALREVKLQDPK